MTKLPVCWLPRDRDQLPAQRSLMDYGTEWSTSYLFFLHMQCLTHLHHVGNSLALGKYLREVLGAEDVTQGGLGEKAGRVMCVLDVRYRHRGVTDSVINNRVDRHRYRVLRQHLPISQSINQSHSVRCPIAEEPDKNFSCRRETARCSTLFTWHALLTIRKKFPCCYFTNVHIIFS